MLSRVFNHSRAARYVAMDSQSAFFAQGRLASLHGAIVGREPSKGNTPMPMVNRLSVLAAYVAFAFVVAILLGVF